jgi:hypothetical protein
MCFGELPLDRESALAELNRRIDRINDSIHDLQESAAKEVRDRQEGVAGLKKDSRLD